MGEREEARARTRERECVWGVGGFEEGWGLGGLGGNLYLEVKGIACIDHRPHDSIKFLRFHLKPLSE